jgi:hypothetical protein
MVLVALAVEAVHWQEVYRDAGPKRAAVFDVGAHATIKAALRRNARVYAFRGDPAVYAELLFDGVTTGRSSSTVVLDTPARPPVGAHLIGLRGECPQCRAVAIDHINSLEEYIYEPAQPGVVRAAFQLASPLLPVGSPLDFMVWVDNLGPKVADHIALTVQLPPSMRLTGRPLYERGYGCDGNSTIVCNIGWLPGHAKTVVHYEVVVGQGGPQTVTASIGTDKLDVNTEGSETAFTVDLTPPAYARSTRPGG